MVNDKHSRLDDYIAMIKQELGTDTVNNIEKNVNDFLVGANLLSASTNKYGFYGSNESLNGDTVLTQANVGSLRTMVEACLPDAPEERIEAAMVACATIMNRYAGKTSCALMGQNLKAEPGTTASNSLDTLFGAGVYNQISNEVYYGTSGSVEAFGQNIDMALPDMKMAMTVTMMRFHTGLMARLYPVRGTSQPNIQYIKEKIELYDLSDATAPTVQFIKMYEDPSMIENNTKLIVPLVANDVDADSNPATGSDNLVSDGVIRFNRKVNLLKLSLDEKQYGQSKFNRTDIICDDSKVSVVYISLKNQEDTTETFAIAIPAAEGTMTRPSKADNSAIRQADVDYTAYLTAGDSQSNGTASAILKALSIPTDPSTGRGTQGIAVQINCRAQIDLLTGVVSNTGWVSIRPFNPAKSAGPQYDEHGNLIPPDQQNLNSDFVTALGKLTAELVGYTVDARFSEENLRKSNIVTRTIRQPFSYDIPTSRNYLYEYAFGQTDTDASAQNLTKVARVGQDHKGLRSSLKAAEEAYNKIQQNTNNPLDPFKYPGMDYVAGDKVNPRVYLGTMDFSGIQTKETSNRSGDIKQFLITYLTGVTSDLLQYSYLRQELGNPAEVTFRVVTSNLVLGNILGAPHIHNHLERGDSRGTGEAIEYVMVLPNGVKLEVITTTFDYMLNRMFFVPIVPGNIESELNFAHYWDYGSLVGHYSPTGEAAFHRIFCNIREVPIVTNPVAAIIDIKGMDNVTYIDGVPGTYHVTLDNVADIPVAETP